MHIFHFHCHYPILSCSKYSRSKHLVFECSFIPFYSPISIFLHPDTAFVTKHPVISILIVLNNHVPDSSLLTVHIFLFPTIPVSYIFESFNSTCLWTNIGSYIGRSTYTLLFQLFLFLTTRTYICVGACAYVHVRTEWLCGYQLLLDGLRKQKLIDI